MTYYTYKWIDPTKIEPEWMTVDDAKDQECSTLESGGWLFHETKSCYYFAGDFDPDEDSGGVNFVTVIPKGCVISMRKVSSANRKKR